MSNEEQATCQHHGLEDVQATRLGDPERRYLRHCRGCGIDWAEFECGRCGRRNAEPKSCPCRTFATGGIVKGPGQLVGDSIRSHLSPGEALLPGPNGTVIHVRGAYGDQPAEITQLDLDDTEDERT